MVYCGWLPKHDHKGSPRKGEHKPRGYISVYYGKVRQTPQERVDRYFCMSRIENATGHDLAYVTNTNRYFR